MDNALKNPRKKEMRPRFRAQVTRNGLAALRKFIWNSNRLAEVLASDTPEEAAGKFMVLALTGNDAERLIARARLKDFAE